MMKRTVLTDPPDGGMSARCGASSDTVTLTAMGMTGTTISSVGGPSLLEGNRYLIAGDDHFVWPCGFSQPYQPDVAGQWAAALAS